MDDSDDKAAVDEAGENESQPPSVSFRAMAKAFGIEHAANQRPDRETGQPQGEQNDQYPAESMFGEKADRAVCTGSSSAEVTSRDDPARR